MSCFLLVLLNVYSIVPSNAVRTVVSDRYHHAAATPYQHLPRIKFAQFAVHSHEEQEREITSIH